MGKWFKSRYIQLGIIFTIMFAVLLFQLHYLTVVQGEQYYEESQSIKRVELTLTGERGDILDRSGIPLASNMQVYAVQLERQRMPSDGQELNEVLAKAIGFIVNNGDNATLTNASPIEYDADDDRFYYSWELLESEESKEFRLFRWLKDIGALEESGEIGDKDFADVDPYNVNDVLQYLRRRYDIDASYSDNMVRMITSVRLDVYLNRYSQYDPIYLAIGISPRTLAQIEAYAKEMIGIQIVVESGRYYPMNESAAHVIGYVSKIPADDLLETRKEQGYDPSRDKIGKGGIEEYAEPWLTGSTTEKQGKLVAEVDSKMRVVRVLEEQAPQAGDDVMLTIDSRLQRSAETILEEELEKMRNGEAEYSSETKVAPLAVKGAVVVLDVNTGEILTLASYPSYDLNLFPNGISSQAYGELLNATGSPLYPLAFKSAMIPGSVFKMLTGMAALMEGVITPTSTVYDRIKYPVGNTTISCWSKTSHGNENIVEAIEHSCNYFFVDVGIRLGIDNIEKWAERFGLTGSTGLEVIESTTEENLNSIRKTESGSAERARIKPLIQKRGYEDVSNECLNALTAEGMTKDSVTNAQIKEILKEHGYFVMDDSDNDGLDDRTGKTSNELLNALNDTVPQIKYELPAEQASAHLTGSTAMGQGELTLTPLTVARYIAAIANGGTILDAHVVQKVMDANTGNVLVNNYTKDQAFVTETFDRDGKLIDKKEIPLNNAGVNEEYLDAIRYGMYQVVNDASYDGGGRGTAFSYFYGMDPSISLAGKTGTAEVRADDEYQNNSWFAGFTPYENPEIAVVVAIPSGRTSGNASVLARKIIEQYYEFKSGRNQGDIGMEGVLYK
jgi:penicillin-binding protein 2